DPRQRDGVVVEVAPVAERELVEGDVLEPALLLGVLAELVGLGLRRPERLEERVEQLLLALFEVPVGPGDAHQPLNDGPVMLVHGAFLPSPPRSVNQGRNEISAPPASAAVSRRRGAMCSRRCSRTSSGLTARSVAPSPQGISI